MCEQEFTDEQLEALLAKITPDVQAFATNAARRYFSRPGKAERWNEMIRKQKALVDRLNSI